MSVNGNLINYNKSLINGTFLEAPELQTLELNGISGTYTYSGSNATLSFTSTEITNFMKSLYDNKTVTAEDGLDLGIEYAKLSINGSYDGATSSMGNYEDIQYKCDLFRTVYLDGVDQRWGGLGMQPYINPNSTLNQSSFSLDSIIIYPTFYYSEWMGSFSKGTFSINMQKLDTSSSFTSTNPWKNKTFNIKLQYKLKSN